MRTQTIHSDRLITIVRQALRAMAHDLASPDLAFWDCDIRAKVALRQGARAGATLRQLLISIKAVAHVYKDEGLTGEKLAREIGPFRYRVDLRNALQRVVSS